MFKNSSVLLFSLLFSVCCFSQKNEYAALLIPQDLKENANAVVRNNSIEITIEDFDKMLVVKREVVTVLNKLGNVDARMAEGYDNDTKITKLSAKIYNAFGKEIKKYKKRDFLDVSAVPGGTLYSDSRLKYVDYTPVSYPYTVVFESEYSTTTTGFIPWWQPINGYYVSVEKSSYKINNLKKIPWRSKKTNFKKFDIKATESETEITFSIENQAGYKYENAAVHYREILPKAILTLNNFSLKGVAGQYKNWKEFGFWMHSRLLVGRDFLEPATIATIKDLVKDAVGPLEKAKLVYAFMQNKTRYISVQVGIGGWEPIPASQVDKVGYGDCKGLTNYTKALLDAAGVTSYYTIVYADEKRDIDKDFSSIQGNHAILNIPNAAGSKEKNIWLECTSQTMPFGFLGDFTEDRNVLVVTPEGGIIKRTTSYKDAQNLQETSAEIQLKKDGSLTAALNILSRGLQYDDKQGYDSLTEDELFKNYKTNVWSYNNNLEIETATLNNNKKTIIFKENLEVSINNYATINDTEYLFRINVFNKNSYVPKRYRKRKLPLKIYRGYKDKDSYKITIPDGYVLGILPEEKEIITKFGTYKVCFKKIDATSFQYDKTVSITEGTYAVEDYKTYRSFRRRMAKYENLRIALTKK
jgi:hypothetical protein